MAKAKDFAVQLQPACRLTGRLQVPLLKRLLSQPAFLIASLMQTAVAAPVIAHVKGALRPSRHIVPAVARDVIAVSVKRSQSGCVICLRSLGGLRRRIRIFRASRTGISCVHRFSSCNNQIVQIRADLY